MDLFSVMHLVDHNSTDDTTSSIVGGLVFPVFCCVGNGETSVCAGDPPVVTSPSHLVTVKTRFAH